MSPGPPRQERSRRTQTRLLDAATELLTENGGAGFTLHEVAERAGVAVGTVYRRFATKEELMVAVFDRLRQAERSIDSATWDDVDTRLMPIAVIIETMVADITRVWREQPAFMRATMLRRLTAGPDDGAFTVGVERMRESVGHFTATISACGRPLAHADPERACNFAFRMIVGMAARRTAQAIETQTPPEPGWDALLEELTDAVARYLFGPDYAAL